MDGKPVSSLLLLLAGLPCYGLPNGRDMCGNMLMKLAIKYILGIGASRQQGSHKANGKEVLVDGVNEYPFPLALCVFWNEGSTFLKYDLPVEFFLYQSDLSCYLEGP